MERYEPMVDEQGLINHWWYCVLDDEARTSYLRDTSAADRAFNEWKEMNHA